MRVLTHPFTSGRDERVAIADVPTANPQTAAARPISCGRRMTGILPKCAVLRLQFPDRADLNAAFAPAESWQQSAALRRDAASMR